MNSFVFITNEPDHAQADILAKVGTAFAVGGGLLAIGAAYAFFTAPHDTITTVGLVPGGVGVFAAGSF